MTQKQRILECLTYDPIAGIFTRKSDGAGFGRVYSDRYMCGYVASVKYRCHRLAFLFMEGEFPASGVDHIDRNPLNNKWENLRHATQAVNMKNKGLYHKNKTGISGVRSEIRWSNWCWLAQIGRNGTTVKILRTKDFFEACCARKSAENRGGYLSKPEDKKADDIGITG
jgi:hypothetical protein